MSELEARPREVTNPATGELVTLDAATDVLAGELEGVKELEANLRSYKRAIGDELLTRMDTEARWSWRGAGLKLQAPSPNVVDYDGEVLWRELEPLVRDGVIGEHAFAAAVERDYAYKAKKAGITALAKLPSTRIQAAINAARLEPKTRTVNVTRA